MTYPLRWRIRSTNITITRDDTFMIEILLSLEMTRLDVIVISIDGVFMLEIIDRDDIFMLELIIITKTSIRSRNNKYHPGWHIHDRHNIITTDDASKLKIILITRDDAFILKIIIISRDNTFMLGIIIIARMTHSLQK